MHFNKIGILDAPESARRQLHIVQIDVSNPATQQRHSHDPDKRGPLAGYRPEMRQRQRLYGHGGAGQGDLDRDVPVPPGQQVFFRSFFFRQNSPK